MVLFLLGCTFVLLFSPLPICCLHFCLQILQSGRSVSHSAYIEVIPQTLGSDIRKFKNILVTKQFT